MADDQQQDQQGDERDQGQEQGQRTQSDKSGGAGGGDDDNEGDDLAKLKSALAAERKRARDLEREVKPLRTYKSERENADKSESEKSAARITELEEAITKAQARERTYALRDALEEAIGAEKLVPAAPIGRLLKLIDADAVDWSDDGKPTNADKLLKGLQKSDPYLFGGRKVPSADGGAGRDGGDKPPSFNDEIRARWRGEQ